ncbi:unnamed protein product [Calicophoron daubneyi]|uniref:Ig-like domain-containing protein n=1 Tax=Calicophoron daubneyi TaxID=300641 RepID=A0AAV2TRN7_CALDB
MTHSKSQILQWTLFILIYVIERRITEAVQGCSVFFQPDFKWKKAICDADVSKLTEIPHDLPTNLVHLHVTHQSIKLLTNQGLVDLIHLENLQIESSEVNRITPDAFRTLVHLKHLSLRNNSLKLGHGGIPQSVLLDLPNLETLNLAENFIDLIPDSFFNVPPVNRIQGLWLGSTKSLRMQIEPRSFFSLENLKILDISFSKLSVLPSDIAIALNTMRNLEEFYLGGNPWHCDCNLRWLRKWYLSGSPAQLQYTLGHIDRQGERAIVEPVCFTPEHLRNKKIFGAEACEFCMGLSEFQCPPKILTEDQNLTVIAGNSIVLSCEFYADPIDAVSWYKNGVLIYNDTHLTASHAPQGDTFISTLHATFNKVTESGIWTCVLGNYYNKASAFFNITVLPYGSSNPNSKQIIIAGISMTHQNWIYAGVGSGLFFLLLILVGVGIFYCCDPRPRSHRCFRPVLRKDDRYCTMNSCLVCEKFGDSSENPKAEESSKTDTERPLDDTKSDVDIYTHLPDTYGSPGKLSIVKSEQITSESLLPSPLINLEPTSEIVGSLGGSLIKETVSTGEGRLLVACDGPEPTVLLATRISSSAGTNSPLSIYGFQNALCSNIPVNTNVTQTVSYFNRQLVPCPNPQVSTYRARGKTSEDASDVVAVDSKRYTTPCPVHGSISIDHLKFPHVRSISPSNQRAEGTSLVLVPTDIAYGTLNDNLTPIKLAAPNVSLNTPKDISEKSSSITSRTSPRKDNNSYSITRSDISNYIQNSIHQNLFVASNPFPEGIEMTDFTHATTLRQRSSANVSTPSAKVTEFPTFPKMHTSADRTHGLNPDLTRSGSRKRQRDGQLQPNVGLKNPEMLGYTRNSGARTSPSEATRFPASDGFPISSTSHLAEHVQINSVPNGRRYPLYSSADSPDKENSSQESWESGKTSESSGSSSPAFPSQNFRDQESNQSDGDSSNTEDQTLYRQGSLCAVHYPRLRGYASQMFPIPAKPYTYRVATLPARIHKNVTTTRSFADFLSHMQKAQRESMHGTTKRTSSPLSVDASTFESLD